MICPRIKSCPDANEDNFTCLNSPENCTKSGVIERTLKNDKRFRMKNQMVGQYA